MRTRLNGRLLAGLAIGTVVLGGLAVGLYAFQIRRISPAWLERAIEAEEKGDYARALEHLEAYLELNPDDVKALSRLGQLQNRFHVPREAFLTLGRVLQLDPKNREARRALVEVDIALEDFDDARKYAEALLEEMTPEERRGPQAAELERLLAITYVRQGNYEESAALLAQAVEHDPSDPTLAGALAEILRQRLDREDEADAVIEAMVDRNPESATAYLQRANYRLRFDRDAEGARADVERARQLDPEGTESIVLASQLARTPEEIRQSLEDLTAALEENAGDPALYHRKARLEVQLRKFKDAEKTLRTGLAILPGDNDLRMMLLEVLGTLGDEKAYDETLQALRRRPDLPPGELEFIEGSVLLRKGKREEAIAKLEAARTLLVTDPERAKQANLLLGVASFELGKTDEAIAAVRRALDLDPSWTAARIRLVDMLAATGQIEQANIQYRLLDNNAQMDAATGLRVAGILLAGNLRLPPDRRNWEGFDRLLDQAATPPPGSVEVILLRAAGAEARNDFDRALALLEEATRVEPTKVESWLALIELSRSRGRPEAEIEALFDRARAAAGDRARLRLARAGELARRGAEIEDIARLAEGIEAMPSDERLELKAGLAELYTRLGDYDRANSLGQEIATERPENLAAHLTAFDRASRAGDVAAMQRSIAEIRRIEEADPATEPAIWRFARAKLKIQQARAQLARSGRGAEVDRLLTEARADLRAVENVQPESPRVPRAEGEISELLGKPDEAIVAYSRAADLGDRDPNLAGLAASLLLRLKRPDEALTWVDRLVEREPNSLRTLTIRLQTFLALRRRDDALALARETLKNPTVKLLPLAQLLEGLRLDEVAREAYQALADRPDTPEGVLVLAGFLGRHGEFDRALELCEGAWKTCKPADVANASLELLNAVGLQGHEAQVRRLDEHINQALRTQPDSFELLSDLAGLRDLEGKFQEEEQYYRKALALNPDYPVALNNLAWLVAAQGHGDEALDLVNRAIAATRAADQKPLPELLDTRATVYLALNQPDRAVADMEAALADDPKPKPLRLFHLAQAYRAAGKADEAAKTLKQAQDAGLKTEDLHPLERPAYRTLLGQAG